MKAVMEIGIKITENIGEEDIGDEDADVFTIKIPLLEDTIISHLTGICILHFIILC